MTRTMTALAALAASLGLAVPAAAQVAAGAVTGQGLISADSIEDGPVYGIDDYDEARWLSDEPYTVDLTPETGKIGEIEDVLLDARGNLAGFLVEAGGFLGIGEANVILPIEDVRVVPVDRGLFDGEGYGIVTRLTEDQLKALPQVDDDLFD